MPLSLADVPASCRHDVFRLLGIHAYERCGLSDQSSWFMHTYLLTYIYIYIYIFVYVDMFIHIQISIYIYI